MNSIALKELGEKVTRLIESSNANDGELRAEMRGKLNGIENALGLILWHLIDFGKLEPGTKESRFLIDLRAEIVRQL